MNTEASGKSTVACIGAKSCMQLLRRLGYFKTGRSSVCGNLLGNGDEAET